MELHKSRGLGITIAGLVDTDTGGEEKEDKSLSVNISKCVIIMLKTRLTRIILLTCAKYV